MLLCSAMFTSLKNGRHIGEPLPWHLDFGQRSKSAAGISDVEVHVRVLSKAFGVGRRPKNYATTPVTAELKNRERNLPRADSKSSLSRAQFQLPLRPPNLTKHGTVQVDVSVDHRFRSKVLFEPVPVDPAPQFAR